MNTGKNISSLFTPSVDDKMSTGANIAGTVNDLYEGSIENLGNQIKKIIDETTSSLKNVLKGFENIFTPNLNLGNVPKITGETFKAVFNVFNEGISWGSRMSGRLPETLEVAGDKLIDGVDHTLFTVRNLIDKTLGKVPLLGEILNPVTTFVTGTLSIGTKILRTLPAASRAVRTTAGNKSVSTHQKVRGKLIPETAEEKAKKEAKDKPSKPEKKKSEKKDKQKKEEKPAKKQKTKPQVKKAA